MACSLLALILPAAAQTTAPASIPAADEPNMVALTFPEDVDLKVLIEYVGKRQGVNFLYDEQLGARKVTIKGPNKIPADSLMTLLGGVLRMKGLAMSPTAVPGMMRIAPVKSLPDISTAPDPDGEAPPPVALTAVVTRIFGLKHASPKRVASVVKPFLSGSGSFVELGEHDMILVTDYADKIRRVEGLMALLDRPGREVETRFVPVKHMEATDLSQQVTKILSGRSKARGDAREAGATLLPDERTNQVVVVGGQQGAAEAIELIASLDVGLGLQTRTYSLSQAGPDRVDRLVRTLIGETAAKRWYDSVVDREANLLIATATPEIHERIVSLVEQLEKPVPTEQSPIRFYSLQNAKAAEVLGTLQNIGGQGLGALAVDGVAVEVQAPAESERPIRGPTEAEVNDPHRQSDKPAGDGAAGGGALELPDARVMADEASNTIIIIADPAVHLVYEKLIQRLDVRRPQVLIEATIVTLDTTDGFSLGVEFSRTDEVDGGEGRTLKFSSFGLSEVDAATGALTLKPGVGFNGALLSADIADVIIHALQSDSRAKVVARPSMLVNDNATGSLVSQTEEPYSSVNASTTVSTTSFGGYSSAGTNISVTPQISEGDHLKLEYEITLSSFEDDGTDRLPPSRKTNSLKSEATIPNGHTIVVGGLTRENFQESVDRVPGLGSIPLVEYLFSNRSLDGRESTLFVFIRAVILRDDKFRDLKVLSREAGRRAELTADYPASEPVEIP